MNDTTRPQHFNEERSKAIEQLLANVAQDGTPENRRFQDTKVKKSCCPASRSPWPYPELP